MSLRFFYNGIKQDDGKLQKCRYSYISKPESCIMIKSENYDLFSYEIQKEFIVINNTNNITDTYDKDHFSVKPDNKY
jgi:hypothetical protein